MSLSKRIVGFWPYILIAVSVTGFVYQFWSGRP
jgi:hypothetical protein